MSNVCQVIVWGTAQQAGGTACAKAENMRERGWSCPDPGVGLGEWEMITQSIVGGRKHLWEYWTGKRDWKLPAVLGHIQ